MYDFDYLKGTKKMDYSKKHQEHLSQYLAENINGRLVILLRDISHTMRSLYEGRGSQKRVLIVLNETGTITQRELTQRLGIQPGSASEVIAKLESMGLVERALSEADRRTADISLTDAGRRRAEEALEQRQRRHEEMFSALTAGEKEQLLSLLEKVNGDWKIRYPDSREPREHHDHRGHHHGHWRDAPLSLENDGEGRYADGRGCDHDCAHCQHPCGRGRKGREE